MKSSPATSVPQVEKFLQLEKTRFVIANKSDRYRWIRQTTWNLKYRELSKEEKGKVKQYLCLITGYSEPHIKRLIAQSIRGELKGPGSTKNRTSFSKKYTPSDIRLFAKFDHLANYPNGFALKENYRRMYEEFGDNRFKRLAYISHGPVYNLRATNIYKGYCTRLKYKKTRSVTQPQIGIREKPNPDGKPGYIRVDSVHGGDKGKEKGVYYINLVDELTQWEVVVCVKGISERFLITCG